MGRALRIGPGFFTGSGPKQNVPHGLIFYLAASDILLIHLFSSLNSSYYKEMFLVLLKWTFSVY